MRLELRSSSLAESEGAILGIWQAPQAEIPAMTQFGTEPGHQTTVDWHVLLSGDLTAAREELHVAETAIAASLQALPVVSGRLGVTSVDALASGGLTDLLSYDLSSPLEHLAQTVGGFAARIAALFAPYATVRTTLGGALVGFSILERNAAIQTVHSRTVTAAQAEIHSRAVGLTLESQLAFARAVAVAFRVSVLVACSAAQPTGTLLALPSAWRAVEEVQREFRADAERLRHVPQQ